MHEIHREIARYRLAELIEETSTPATRRLDWARSGRRRRMFTRRR